MGCEGIPGCHTEEATADCSWEAGPGQKRQLRGELEGGAQGSWLLLFLCFSFVGTALPAVSRTTFSKGVGASTFIPAIRNDQQSLSQGEHLAEGVSHCAIYWFPLFRKVL